MKQQVSIPVIIGTVVVAVLIIGFFAYRVAVPIARAVSRSTSAPGMPGGNGAPPPDASKPISTSAASWGGQPGQSAPPAGVGAGMPSSPSGAPPDASSPLSSNPQAWGGQPGQSMPPAGVGR